ncbi:magnesium transporter [Paramagnetospirillum marisnigri]|uniref:Magnesium transporter n=1 Tax=Paramagnetospirillum marisnigri TaxID=1285242 RepID=A0A178M6J2_9PROT|nr:magnesium and cobalt transport protein CorA [Paramagnetospirillum marisnigri]OAN43004.1 magnesium transporter [Paramagnetospirillum marisnigri]
MSLQTVLELLGKQKIVEAMVRSQASRQHELVEGITHKQHIAELHSVLARQSATEIGRILEAVPVEDAQRLWPLLPPDRINDVLWEISSVLGGQLAGARVPEFRQGQVAAYVVVDGRIRILDLESRADFDGLQPLWIDILDATRSERGWIARHYGLELPNPEELTDLEVSARFYEEESDEVHLHSNFLLAREDKARSVPVAFIIHDKILFTVRNEELPVFRLQRLRARNQPSKAFDCKDMLLDLYGADVEYSADQLEDTYSTLRRVGQEVLGESLSDTDASRILSDIAEEEDLNGLIRGNMLDTQRAVSFLIRGRFLSPSQTEDAKEILRDIDSLNSHTTFLFEKINFLMDATIGFINVNQNRRVTQLTVVSVVFMPLNVLAGVGGMSEFSMMTQGIPWPISYSAFTISLLLVGWATYLILKNFEKRRIKGRVVDNSVRK